LIKGSPYPRLVNHDLFFTMVKVKGMFNDCWLCLFVCFRGYYKCTRMKDCPAKKKVERAKDDPKMMIVTYEEHHCHIWELTIGWNY
jgi:hypothetical protein